MPFGMDAATQPTPPPSTQMDDQQLVDSEEVANIVSVPAWKQAHHTISATLITPARAHFAFKDDVSEGESRG